VSLCIVGLVIMVETTGDMIAISEIVEKPLTRQRLADGLRADGLSTVLGGVFNTFPYTAFAQNVGLVSITGVRSRYVATFAGAVLVLLGLFPKLGAVFAGLPIAVLGGAGIALFGMVAASGIRTLSKVRFNNSNILVVALAVGIGLLPTVYPTIYDQFPDWFQTIFDSGISAGAITAVVLNLLLNSEARQRRLAGEGDLAGHDANRGVQSPAGAPGTSGAGVEPLEVDRP
jgi:uric acid transporter